MKLQYKLEMRRLAGLAWNEEGIETQDITQATERHSTHSGVPAEMYIDQGTQLKAMDQTSFSVRDLQMQVIDSLGIRLQVSNAKSPEERGRVENQNHKGDPGENWY